MEITKLAELQKELAKKVEIPSGTDGYKPTEGDLLFSLDIQYKGEDAYIALDVQKWKGEHLATYVALAEAGCEYVPQYFCFREGPPLLKVIQEVEKRFALTPQLIIIDGHGLAHPRRFGVACWIGIHTQIPTIGCAKETLLRYQGEVSEKRGDILPIVENQETVGVVLRTQHQIKPVFVSAGHKISLENATKVMLELSPRYRISEPIRRADQNCRAFAKGQTSKTMTILSEIS